MTSNKHDFEELQTPKAAAKELGISVATLRKYSLIVEKVTGNHQYFERTKQNARLYHQKDIADLDAFHKLAKNNGLTLQEAARQIYEVTDQAETAKKRAKAQEEPKEIMSTAQMVKLLTALQHTIATQNEAISSLQQQLNKIEKQNQTLLDEQKQLAAPKAQPQTTLPDISEVVSAEEIKTPEEEKAQKRAEVEADKEKSQAEMHEQIIAKAKENAKKRATANVHRTLEDMQVPVKKKHWWQRFLNY
ncbi:MULTISPECIES: MerR family transcriptional regulator [Lactobacillus]|uniref:MerR family transcriptional regulator n=1 Tax=Lactobacillus xujianguonis TaxID=2495899 RepID=A0A437SW14_9LACO|nr:MULTISPECIES: MerR family transcriptional regulator [Lactobacillus]RVU71050.1 MerR family transcriptional regulator [Lactobacillus xujianguonis]RVU76794.1 MerR family transcriptional regulator [Lactobacillus xujianguonis]